MARLSGDYIYLSNRQVIHVLDGMFSMSFAFRSLVYSKLRRAKEHRFGTMRAWLKGKSVVQVPLRWSDVSWRPLISYSRHFWVHALSYLSKLCHYIIVRYRLGSAVLDPRTVMRKLELFNERWYRANLRFGARLELCWDVCDVSEFFVHMPRERVRQVLTKWVRILQEDSPGKEFFCISKHKSVERLQPLGERGGGRKRTQRMKQRCCMASKVSTHETGMRLSEVVGLLKWIIAVIW